MTPQAAAKFEQCNCLAVRQAARHLTQFYDQFLAQSGLRTTQFSILAKLMGLGPLSINALAKELVMDRTTLGRNMLPLEREGLIEIVAGTSDRRTRELRLTRAGHERMQAAAPGWNAAQAKFEASFGRKRSSELRALLDQVVASEL
ncbi:MarR family winged helix-turn-helix transcriptional regulator [Dongia sp.]|uniref:MarR family winged helix-turn-helix transcriptional regulator n=1 Tax=Dongia sp. TaxID=1977262 RepID=UPI0035B10842